MNIYFNLGEHIHYNSSNFLNTVLTAFIGASFGFMFGLLINSLANKKRKKKEFNKLISKYKYKMNYLLSTIEKVKGAVEKQLNNYSEFAKKIKELPYQIHIPRLVATYDYERLKDYSSSFLLEAYLFFEIGKNSDTYDDIFISADLISNRFKENQKAHARFADEIYKLQKSAIKETNKLGLKLINKADEIKANKPTEYKTDTEFKYLFTYIQINQDIAKNDIANFQRVDEEFLQPLIRANQSVSDFEFCSDLYSSIKLIQDKFQNIKGNSLMYADHLAKEPDNLNITLAKKSLSDAKNKLKELLDNFEAP